MVETPNANESVNESQILDKISDANAVTFPNATVEVNRDEGVCRFGNITGGGKVFDYIDKTNQKRSIEVYILEHNKYTIRIQKVGESKISEEEITANSQDDFNKKLGKKLDETIGKISDGKRGSLLNTGQQIYSDLKKLKPKLADIEEGLKSVQKKIEETGESGENKDWKERGNIVFDEKTSSINSRKNRTKIEQVDGDSMRLKGLDLDLSIEEGIWLANFKNWVEYMKSKYLKKNEGKMVGHRVQYGQNEFYESWEYYPQLEYTRGVMNKNFAYRKTFYLDDTMLITRTDLEKWIPACSSEETMEKIANWLATHR